MVALFLILNFAISWLNAWACGREWYETKKIGGFPRFMSWMGAIMSACGFSWCYLIIIAFIAGPDGLHKLPLKYVNGMVSLGYLALILPIIGSGIAITIDSWMYFWRRRDLASGAIAGYNTFADIYNIAHALHDVPSAWKDLGDLFSSDDKDDNPFIRWMIVLAILALVGGILTTSMIIKSVSRSAVQDRKMAFEFEKLSRETARG